MFSMANFQTAVLPFPEVNPKTSDTNIKKSFDYCHRKIRFLLMLGFPKQPKNMNRVFSQTHL